ncbi:MAG: hypothetical protein ABH811_01975 [archaeon]
MEYKITIGNERKGMTYEKVHNLAEKVKESVHGVTNYYVDFLVNEPLLGFEDLTTKSTYAIIKFCGKSFNPATIMSEFCQEGNSIINSKCKT